VALTLDGRAESTCYSRNFLGGTQKPTSGYLV
jgi:hypothetical protein